MCVCAFFCYSRFPEIWLIQFNNSPTYESTLIPIPILLLLLLLPLLLLSLLSCHTRHLYFANQPLDALYLNNKKLCLFIPTTQHYQCRSFDFKHPETTYHINLNRITQRPYVIIYKYTLYTQTHRQSIPTLSPEMESVNNGDDRCEWKIDKRQIDFRFSIESEIH